jgi:hypothetical protein
MQLRVLYIHRRAQGNLAGRATAEGRIEVSVQGHAAALLQVQWVS